MFEEFIEANKVPAEIVHKRLSGNLVKCVLLVPGKKTEMPVLAVFPAGKRISTEKAAKGANCSELRQAREEETIKIAGYESGFIPPVSVYGVRVLLDDSILERQFVNVIIGKEKTLKIKPSAIIEFNEEAIACSIVEE